MTPLRTTSTTVIERRMERLERQVAAYRDDLLNARLEQLAKTGRRWRAFGYLCMVVQIAVALAVAT